MASTRIFKSNFAGGEISERMWGRIDDAKYQGGAAKMRNFIATPQGPAPARAGFEYVASTKNNGAARLIPFIYSLDQAMVIELGDHYARFHALGETLDFDPSSVPAWTPPSGDLTLTYTAPAQITWTAHGLADGDPVRFYLYDSTGNFTLPGGLRLAYTYTVKVIDANTISLLDNGQSVSLTAPGGGGGYTGPTTNYPGSGTAVLGVTSIPGDGGQTGTSAPLTGLPNVTAIGGVATLHAALYFSLASPNAKPVGNVQLQYTTDGTTWVTAAYLSQSTTTTVDLSIGIANLSTLQLRLTGTVQDSVSLFAEITSWSVDAYTAAPTPAATGTLRAYKYYAAGEMVSYGGSVYMAVADDGGGTITPGTDSGLWWEPETEGSIYEVPTPWAAADLFALHYAQSNDVMTIVHPSYPPYELVRVSATTWTCKPVSFSPSINPPTGVSVTASPGYSVGVSSISAASPAVFTTAANHQLDAGSGIYIKGLLKSGVDASGFYLVNSIPVDGSGDLILNELTVMDYDGNVLDNSGSIYTGTVSIQYGEKAYSIDTYYAVAAISSDNITQSVISGPVHVINNLDVPGSYNTISWTSVPGAGRYEVYEKRNGLWGYIGETTDTQFVDNNIAPDMGTTPPIYDTVFNATDAYPAAVGYYEQRKAYGGTNNKPLTLWMSRAGTEDNFSYSLPTVDSDRIAVTIAALRRNAIKHIVPLAQLLLLTDSSEIRVSPVNSDTLSPTTIAARPQSYVGSSDVVPCVVNNSLVFCAATGGHVKELGYSWQAEGFVTGDLSLRASHLFDNKTILDMTYQRAPQPVVWFVSSNGRLLGMTYVPEEQIGAWHWHDTDGIFESICAIPEGQEDRLYAIIRRVVNGATVRYIERMASTLFLETDDETPVDQTEAFYMDAGARFDGTNTSTTTIAVTVEDAPGGGTRYKLTASAAVFAYPATTDIGDVVWLTLADGSTAAVKIASEDSTTVAYSSAGAVPDPDPLAGLTTASWAWARNALSGLTWLEGETLSVLADGAVHPQVTVSGGTVKLQRPAVKVNVGLPYVMDLEVLPPIMQVDGYGQGRSKNINKAWLRVWRSGGIFIGPDADNLEEVKPRMDEGYGVPPALKTEEIEMTLLPEWQQDGTILIRQTDPLPLTVVGLTLEVAIGG